MDGEYIRMVSAVPAAVIIPALNPDEALPRMIDEMEAMGFARFIVVDDGSAAASRGIFDAVRARESCTLLTHARNRGKGRALKTAFAYYLSHPLEYGGCRGVVTVDADGQHRALDAARCARAMCGRAGGMVLGCRNFSGKGVPARSRVGNRATRCVFRLLCGMDISDTQTGLRAVSNEMLGAFLTVRGEAFDYEMNMLVKAVQLKEQGRALSEVPIATIYSPRNASSHFRPIRDSMRVYSVFLRFIASSLAAFLVDMGLFALLCPLFSIAVSTAGARAVSSAVNFYLNKRAVFCREGAVRSCLYRYTALCAAQMLCSALLVTILAGLVSAPVPLLKAAVDTVLFFISYQAQRRWVFRAARVNKPC